MKTKRGKYVTENAVVLERHERKVVKKHHKLKQYLLPLIEFCDPL